jgi:hypothetical protein
MYTESINEHFDKTSTQSEQKELHIEDKIHFSYRGKQSHHMSRAELLEAMNEMGKQIEYMYKQHGSDLKTLTSL